MVDKREISFPPVREASNGIHTHVSILCLDSMALQQGVCLLYYRCTLTDGLRHFIVCIERPKLLQFSAGSGKVQFVCQGSRAPEDNSLKTHLAFIMMVLGCRQVLALTDQ